MPNYNHSQTSVFVFSGNLIRTREHRKNVKFPDFPDFLVPQNFPLPPVTHCLQAIGHFRYIQIQLDSEAQSSLINMVTQFPLFVSLSLAAVLNFIISKVVYSLLSSQYIRLTTLIHQSVFQPSLCSDLRFTFVSFSEFCFMPVSKARAHFSAPSSSKLNLGINLVSFKERSQS